MSVSAIWKYPLTSDTLSRTELPRGAKLVHAGQQNAVQTLWFKIDPQAEKELVRFQIFGTGHDFPSVGEHVHTFYEGPFVWHVVLFRISRPA